MKNTKTNWTSPKTNIIAAANDLRKCLASGCKGRLIKILNEECQYPILLDKNELSNDFREYEFTYSAPSTKAEILADTSMTDFEKKLSLEYKSFFGTEDAVKRYYETSILSAGNFLGMGKSHLVKVTDLIEYLQRSNKKGDKDYARLFYHYKDQVDDRHLYDYFHLKNAQQRTPKEFKHKLWVVEMCGKDDVLPKAKAEVRVIMSMITILVYPLKYIPQKDVLVMDKYKCVSYRIGDVVHGYRVEFQIPRKFSFKDNIK